jgi:hypothetical protein
MCQQYGNQYVFYEGAAVLRYQAVGCQAERRSSCQSRYKQYKGSVWQRGNKTLFVKVVLCCAWC